ncbi:MAG: LacI family DNA-binding transcriptional regulator [Reyranella sp.]|nr:LacI family DNA-binding transcriptional regulator [Reyranella sp.]
MNRPTIADLAQASGVSVSTVNRILGGSTSVRTRTIDKVKKAAEEIGFYGSGVIDARMRASKPRYTLGFLLQQSTRELYQLFAQKIRDAAVSKVDAEITPVIEFVDRLEPENIAGRLRTLGEKCDCVAVIAADHPLVSQAIQALRAESRPVVAYITDQSAPGRAGYVGTDNWKLGRTAAWFIAKTTHGPGRVAVFIGNYRYQCQDIADASFRSYLRENASRLTVEGSLPTHEEPDEAHRIVSRLLHEMDDLAGIFIVGGGISGVLRALREAPDRKRSVSLICRDMGPETRKGLAEGLITAALCHPLEQTSAQLVQTMIDSVGHTAEGAILHRSIPFEIITPENVS